MHLQLVQTGKNMRRKPQHTCVTGSASAKTHVYWRIGGGALATPRSNLFYFHAVFSKKLPNNNLPPPPPPPRQILDPSNDETKILPCMLILCIKVRWLAKKAKGTVELVFIWKISNPTKYKIFTVCSNNIAETSCRFCEFLSSRCFWKKMPWVTWEWLVQTLSNRSWSCLQTSQHYCLAWYRTTKH